MATPDTTSQPLAELVSYLFTRREAILSNWRSTCEQDPSLENVSVLSREEFNNLLPIVLDILEQRLADKPLEADPNLAAQAHGLHRWHKSHSLLETMRELNHLTQILYGELELFQQLFPGRDPVVLSRTHQQIALIMQQTIDGSVQKYDELQQLQSASRVITLQQAIDQMEAMANQRGELLRTSSHDLRGGIGIATSAASLLQLEELSEQDRTQFMDMLSRNLTNVRHLLEELMDLSRLEAGQDQVQFDSVDVAQLLQELVASVQPMAIQQNVILRADGPPTLTVKTDRVKLHRIVQNLLINSLQYSSPSVGRAAIVSVSWSTEGTYRWGFSVQDSGPGLPAATMAGALGAQLRPTVEPTAVLSPDQSEPVHVLPTHVPAVPTGDTLARLTDQSGKGEGVGLYIVKRLCELLDANLDVETQPGRGTLFRVRLPIHPVN